MERLKKALELAKAERDGKVEPTLLDESVVAFNPNVPPVNAQDTVIIRTTRQIEVDAAVLNANGVLPPDTNSPAGHAYRMLRTQVLQRMRQRGWNTLAVVSPTPNDGKTFTAINLAIAIAADTKHTTLLVDFDLRKPSVHERFGFSPDFGIEQCLREECSVGDVLVNPFGYKKLLLAPARSSVPNSSELLSSDITRQLISEMKNRYPNRIVLFDLPPVLGADDALAFAPQVDAAIVVVGEERTRREDLVRTFEILHDVPIIGTVLNGSRTDSSLSYAY